MSITHLCERYGASNLFNFREGNVSDIISAQEFIVKSKVKVLIKEADMRISGEAWNSLGHQVTRAVKQAIRRAKANGRKTVNGSDF